MAKLWRQPPAPLPRPGGKVWLRSEEPRPISPAPVPRAQVGVGAGGGGGKLRDTFRSLEHQTAQDTPISTYAPTRTTDFSPLPRSLLLIRSPRTPNLCTTSGRELLGLRGDG